MSFADMAGLSQSEVAILQSLGQRRAQLDQRATEMETRSGLLTAAERRVEERVAELRRLEASVNELLGKLDEEQERRMTGLVDVYQRMRARDAAQVFDGLDDDTLLDVASRMRQQNLAEIMGQMQPVRARELTRMLAARAQPGDAQALLNAARGQAPAPR
jgi:flagellar motility protein MotE (MotC chaperone)